MYASLLHNTKAVYLFEKLGKLKYIINRIFDTAIKLRGFKVNRILNGSRLISALIPEGSTEIAH